MVETGSPLLRLLLFQEQVDWKSNIVIVVGSMKVELEKSGEGHHRFIGVLPDQVHQRSDQDLNSNGGHCDIDSTLDCYEDPQKKESACFILSQRLADVFHEKHHGE